MKSIVQNKKECYLCGSTRNLEEHHIFFGTGLRKISEKLGLKIYLCDTHHRSSVGVHQDRKLDLIFKKAAQKKYEEIHTREEFMKLIGRNYL